MRIGLVGGGGMGTVHYMGYQHIGGAEVAAVVGKSQQDRDKASGWKLPLYETIPEMIAAQDIDLVDICTPTFLHHEHVCQALAAKKHVICEKPLALKSEQARQMYRRVDEAGVQLYVAHVLQFYPESEALHALVKSGEYGKPLDAYFMRLSACPRWAQDGWLFDRDKSGLVPFDLHIHDLDLIVSLFGAPQGHTFTSCGGADKPYKEQYRFTYNYGPLNVVAEAGWLNADIPFTTRWQVYFENGLVFCEGGQMTGYQFDREPRVFDIEEKVKIPTGINVPPTGTYLAELTHFLDCARENRPSARVPRQQVLTVIELLEAVTAQA